MVDVRVPQNSSEDGDGGHEREVDSQEDTSALRELENMHAFLVSENDRLKEQVDLLTAELEGLNISISAAKKDLGSYTTRKLDATGNVDLLKSERDRLVSEINRLHLQNKTINQEIELSSHLWENMADELDFLLEEKAVVVRRLNDVQSGLHRLSKDKETKLPRLKEYDSVLKEIYRTFKDAQNRIEVSMLLKQK